MASPAGLEVTPRASIDTIVCERPLSPKGDPSPTGQQTQDGVVILRTENNTPSQPTSRMTRGFRPLRSAEVPQDQRIEWEHIRTQLGLEDAEEGRVDNFRDQLGLADNDDDWVNLLKQIGQACLVLLTSPFMLLHGVFKVTGAFCKCLGTFFTVLAALCKKLTYKPRKCQSGHNDQRAGPIQI